MLDQDALFAMLSQRSNDGFVSGCSLQYLSEEVREMMRIPTTSFGLTAPSLRRALSSGNNLARSQNGNNRSLFRCLPPVRRCSRQRRAASLVPSALRPCSLESTTRGTIAKIEPNLDIAL